MTRQGEETRTRLIRTATALFQSQGYHATGVAAILSSAGEEALTVAAVDWLAEEMAGRFARATSGGIPASKQVLRLFTDTAAWLEAHDYSQGALLSLLAQEVEPSETALRSRVSQAYRDASDQLAEALEAGGADAPRDLAVTVLAALDGCVARARAQRSSAALHDTGRILAAAAGGPAPG